MQSKKFFLEVCVCMRDVREPELEAIGLLAVLCFCLVALCLSSSYEQLGCSRKQHVYCNIIVLCEVLLGHLTMYTSGYVLHIPGGYRVIIPAVISCSLDLCLLLSSAWFTMMHFSDYRNWELDKHSKRPPANQANINRSAVPWLPWLLAMLLEGLHWHGVSWLLFSPSSLYLYAG